MKVRLLFAALPLILVLVVSVARGQSGGSRPPLHLDPLPPSTPPPPPEAGFLRLCGFTGQVALRDYPGTNGNVLWYMQPGDSPVPKPELEYDQNGIEWRRMTFGVLDGWVRTRKPNGTEIALCLGT